MISDIRHHSGECFVSNKTSYLLFFFRALRFEHDPQTLPRQLTQPRHPYGTRKLLLSAAPFPT